VIIATGIDMGPKRGIIPNNIPCQNLTDGTLPKNNNQELSEYVHVNPPTIDAINIMNKKVPHPSPKTFCTSDIIMTLPFRLFFHF
jgi:hypothetical protein